MKCNHSTAFCDSQMIDATNHKDFLRLIACSKSMINDCAASIFETSLHLNRFSELLTPRSAILLIASQIFRKKFHLYEIFARQSISCHQRSVCRPTSWNIVIKSSTKFYRQYIALRHAWQLLFQFTGHRRKLYVLLIKCLSWYVGIDILWRLEISNIAW